MGQRGLQRFRIAGWKCLKSLRITMGGNTGQILMGFLGLERRGKLFPKEIGNTSGLAANTPLSARKTAVV